MPLVARGASRGEAASGIDRSEQLKFLHSLISETRSRTMSRLDNASCIMQLYEHHTLWNEHIMQTFMHALVSMVRWTTIETLIETRLKPWLKARWNPTEIDRNTNYHCNLRHHVVKRMPYMYLLDETHSLRKTLSLYLIDNLNYEWTSLRGYQLNVWLNDQSEWCDPLRGRERIRQPYPVRIS